MNVMISQLTGQQHTKLVIIIHYRYTKKKNTVLHQIYDFFRPTFRVMCFALLYYVDYESSVCYVT